MKAQYYNNFDEVVRVVRIFDNGADQAFMDCLMFENSLEEADKALRRCNLIRKDRWAARRWGFETRVYWKAEGR